MTIGTPAGGAGHSFWRVSAAEARMHALILAVVLWATAIVTLSLGTTYRDPFGQLKWADFIQFYTMGDIGLRGPSADLYDPQGLYQRQIALVPESSPEHYLPVYPPQMALVFAPFSRLSYLWAAALWALASIGVYAWSLRATWPFARSALGTSWLVPVCAAAFPPFWSSILNGQTTTVPIVAFACATLALSRQRKFLAGLALGLLLIKPQFGLMVAVVVLACGEWAILAGVLACACVQLIIVSSVLGPSVLVDYLYVIARLGRIHTALEPSIEQMHSLTVVTRLLPGGLDVIVWLVASTAVAFMTVRVWRSDVPIAVRMGALVLASMLVDPHVILYDEAVLAAPLVSLSAWVEMQSGRGLDVRPRWRLALYALFVFLLVPSARVIGLQITPFVMLFLMYTTWRLATTPSPASTTRAVVAAAV